jgi:hypothetical protein
MVPLFPLFSTLLFECYYILLLDHQGKDYTIALSALYKIKKFFLTFKLNLLFSLLIGSKKMQIYKTLSL